MWVMRLEKRSCTDGGLTCGRKRDIRRSWTDDGVRLVDRDVWEEDDGISKGLRIVVRTVQNLAPHLMNATNIQKQNSNS
ncbi:hypothetical protein MRB53_023398 [Persea americana]|uniref:Uncharacterized protein n=1 Tax=Persea americana TaxID=3435 RepID=A0ACC2L9F5_PERAE|nr:hypothetical protein MRB53_023398 [Persea americana]